MAERDDSVFDQLSPRARAELQQLCPGQMFYVPVKEDAELAKRNAEIRAARTRKRNPSTINELAKRFGLSKRQICNILAERG